MTKLSYSNELSQRISRTTNIPVSMIIQNVMHVLSETIANNPTIFKRNEPPFNTIYFGPMPSLDSSDYADKHRRSLSATIGTWSVYNAIDQDIFETVCMPTNDMDKMAFFLMAGNHLGTTCISRIYTDHGYHVYSAFNDKGQLMAKCVKAQSDHTWPDGFTTTVTTNLNSSKWIRIFE